MYAMKYMLYTQSMGSIYDIHIIHAIVAIHTLHLYMPYISPVPHLSSYVPSKISIIIE